LWKLRKQQELGFQVGLSSDPQNGESRPFPEDPNKYFFGIYDPKLDPKYREFVEKGPLPAKPRYK
jgi:hypothetical protein